MCKLIHRIDEAGDLFTIDGLAVTPDVFEAYREAGFACRIEDRTRQLLNLRAAAPKRADAGRLIAAQADASDLALFRHASQPELPL